MSFSWQGGRQFAGVTKDGTTTSYTYNENGLRTAKTTGTETTSYYYSGDVLTGLETSSHSLYFHYDENGGIIGYTKHTVSTDTEYFYVKNLQGDILQVIDAAGNTAAQYSYDAWGNILTATGPEAETNLIRYRGYYFDTETGLYYVSSRYYDPEICRWINADSFASTGQGFIGCNMFAYCLNNPVNLIDKTGQDAATLAAEWGATMWWLNWVDGLLPVGDIIYWGGWGLLTIGAIIFVDYAATTYSNTSYSKPTSSSNQNAETQTKYVSDFGSTTAPPPGPNRPQNDRRTNVNKYESPQWRRFNNVKNSRLKTTGRGSNQRFYDWDYTHNDIEVYNYRGEHLGSMDPVTGEMYKPPVPGRIIKIP